VFIALGIQHAIRMRPYFTCGMSDTIIVYFSTLFHKRYGFREKEGLLKMKYVF